MTGSGRGTREVGGGADRWGPGVSGWARAVAGCGRRQGARLLGWARLLLGCAKLGRVGKRGGELGWGWCWAAEKKERGQRAECEEGEEMEGNFLFLFINKIFKLIFKRFLKSFSI